MGAPPNFVVLLPSLAATLSCCLLWLLTHAAFSDFFRPLTDRCLQYTTQCCCHSLAVVLHPGCCLHWLLLCIIRTAHMLTCILPGYFQCHFQDTFEEFNIPRVSNKIWELHNYFNFHFWTYGKFGSTSQFCHIEKSPKKSFVFDMILIVPWYFRLNLDLSNFSWFSFKLFSLFV